MADEHSTTGASGPTSTQVTRNRACGIRWQWQLRPLSTFPAHCDSFIFPINIFEIETDDFARAQTKPSQ